jgi:hypothetical protein
MNNNIWLAKITEHNMKKNQNDNAKVICLYKMYKMLNRDDTGYNVKLIQKYIFPTHKMHGGLASID